MTWKATKSRSDLYIILDNDDPQLNSYQRHQGVTYITIPRMNMCPKVNAALRFVTNYKYLAFMADDIQFRTTDWDAKAIKMIEDHGGWGIFYGDDLFQGSRLPTHWVISANIVRLLGWMMLPSLWHLYCDNVMQELGRSLDMLYYDPGVVWEHCHFQASKSPRDEIYSIVNSPAYADHDRAAFELWRQNGKNKDIQKILAARPAST